MDGESRSPRLFREVRGQPKNGKVWRSTLEQRFAEVESNLSSSRKRLIGAMLDNPEDIYFLSSRALAKHYKLDTATIVRTIQALGYSRFAEFAADLRAHFVTRITPYSVMKSAAREGRSAVDQVNHSLEADEQNLHMLRTSVEPRRVIELAKRLKRARKITVVGIDFAASLSSLLAYGLSALGFDAEAPVGSAGNLSQKILLLSPKDILIAISFGRCLQDTVDAVIHTRKQGVATFGITDSERSPIARFCDSAWIVSIAGPSFHGSYVAPVAAINALLIACAQLTSKRSLSVLRRKEQEFRSRWYSPRDNQELLIKTGRE